MGADRVDALPLLDEDKAQVVFDIDMAMMRQTPRLGPRPRAMLGAERDHALAMLGGEDDVAGDEDHDIASTAFEILFKTFRKSLNLTFPLASYTILAICIFP